MYFTEYKRSSALTLHKGSRGETLLKGHRWATDVPDEGQYLTAGQLLIPTHLGFRCKSLNK